MGQPLRVVGLREVDAFLSTFCLVNFERRRLEQNIVKSTCAPTVVERAKNMAAICLHDVFHDMLVY
jgi:hypothetical protein